VNNFTYKPDRCDPYEQLLDGHGLTPGATNESGHVVDRFWIMDTKATGFAYTTNADIALNFVYDQSEVTGGNTITGTTPLLAQRFQNVTIAGGIIFPHTAGPIPEAQPLL
jgi:hypothetical protein